MFMFALELVSISTAPFSYLQIFYFIGFGFFTLESLLSIWVIQVHQLDFDYLGHNTVSLLGFLSMIFFLLPCAASIHVLPRQR